MKKAILMLTALAMWWAGVDIFLLGIVFDMDLKWGLLFLPIGSFLCVSSGMLLAYADK